MTLLPTPLSFLRKDSIRTGFLLAFSLGLSLGIRTVAAHDVVLEVPFTIQNTVDYAHPGLFVRGGIPLPRGTVRTPFHFEVRDAAGGALAAQVNPTAWWPDGSLKWVLVIVRAPQRPLATAAYTMRILSGAAPDSTRAIHLEETEDSVLVDTGRLRFRVPRRGIGLVAEASLRSATGTEIPLVDESRPAELFATIERRQAGNAETVDFSANAGPAESVTVEEWGTQRVVLRIDGTHRSTTGETFAPYTVRLRAHAGSAVVEVVHSFTFTGDPERDFLRGLGLRLPTALPVVDRYALAGEHGWGHVIEHPVGSNLPVWRRGLLAQNGSSHYSIRKWIDPENHSPVRMEEGSHSQGWGRLEGGGAAVAVGVHNFWQEYPKALEIDAPTATVTAYLYSPYGDALDLRRYAAQTHAELYETSASGPEPAPLQPESDWIDHVQVDDLGARHIGKTSELFIDFAAGVDRDRASREALFRQDPPLLSAGPAWIAASRALGDFAVGEAAAAGPAATRLREIVAFLAAEPDRRHWYSFLDYGDLVHSYDPGRDHWRRDQGGYAWNNNEHCIAEGLWAGYLHTGDPAAFRLAAAQTRHVGDVDMYHGGPLAGNGTRHNVNHYGCMAKKRRMTQPANKRIHYFLTGDERTRDLIDFVHDSLLANELEAEVMRERRNTMDLAVYAAALLFRWETTGDAREGERLRRTTEALCAHRIRGRGFRQYLRFDPATGAVDLPVGAGLAQTKFRLNPAGGGLPADDPSREAQTQSFLLRFGPMDVLLDTVELTGSDVVRQAILDWAELLLMDPAEARRYQGHFSPGIAAGRVAAYAFRQTGDERYRDLLRAWLADPAIWFETVGGEDALHPPRTVPRNGARDATAAQRAAEKFQLRDMADLLRNGPDALEVLAR